MGQEEHDIILQRVRESKVRFLYDTTYMILFLTITAYAAAYFFIEKFFRSGGII